MPIKTSHKPTMQRLKEAQADTFMQQAVAKAQDAQWQKRPAARNALGDWPQWRELGEQIRQHVIQYLLDYLEEFAQNVEARGGTVYFASTDEEATTYIRDLAIRRQVHHIVKSKSMVTTEIGLDQALLALPDVTLLESDLAEFILQEDDFDEPTHIVFPTLHKNRDQIKVIFEKLGYTGDNDPQHLARFARGYLRESFLQADMGITGCNFAVADSGLVNIVTNEGNADLVMAIPQCQVVVMGMERLVPSLQDAAVLDTMLSRSAVGQAMTSYASFSGPAMPEEADGPEDFHVVIVDNGRSRALGGDFEAVLQCIRCGACLNVCPVYRHIGGHGYGSVYPGPIGAVLSPILGGYAAFGDLPKLSSLCGACSETCPVKIPLHQLLIKHRAVMAEAAHRERAFDRLIMHGIGMATGVPRVFGMALGCDHFISAAFAKTSKQTVGNFFNHGGHFDWAPGLAGGWTQSRDLPRPPRRRDNFRSWYQQQEARHD